MFNPHSQKVVIGYSLVLLQTSFFFFFQNFKSLLQILYDSRKIYLFRFFVQLDTDTLFFICDICQTLMSTVKQGHVHRC